MNTLIIDTETANTLEQPMPYDIGYTIFDDTTYETLVERSFVVEEIFFDIELMQQAHFAEKIPQYLQEIAQGKRVVLPICAIRRIIREDCKQYGITRIGAYNMSFDKRAVRNDVRFISGSMVRWFFPYGMEYFDIWHMACSSVLATPEYIEFAYGCDLISEKGNVLTNAEACYWFLTRNPFFKEAHTALEDAQAEKVIYMVIKEMGVEYDDSIYTACWKKVQKVRDEIRG